MKKVVFSGCSFTAGGGWHKNPEDHSDCKDAPELWVNLCVNGIDRLKNLECVNVGSCSGVSNTDIFESTVQAITDYNKDIDIIFCQWTAMPKYQFNVGLELWNTKEGLRKEHRAQHDHHHSNGNTVDRAYIDDLLDRFLSLHNLHFEIIKVVRYTNILTKLAALTGTKIFFINGLCPWDANYFTKQVNFQPEDLTEFTKKDIIGIDSRSDNDIFNLYQQIHNDYDQAGGVDPAVWINLYDSMATGKVDVNYNLRHPGTQSNQKYFSQIKSKLDSLI